MSEKTAVVLFNLGGPDSLASVRRFLLNLFSDPAILRVPKPLRFLFARFIAFRRVRAAKAIYAKMGGKSPLLEETRKQALALEQALGENHRVFIAMRYFHPLTEEAVAQVKAWGPDRIVLLPLYPQYSTTTTASSLDRWKEESKRQGLHAPTRSICCYPLQENFIRAHAALLRPVYEQASRHGKPRVIFSAHGLPEKIVADGDPYAWQVEQTALAIAREISLPDYIVSYQSRVGPLQWTEPYTDQAILHAAKEKNPIVVVPIAFVSEHSETLVELDMEYRELAEKNGCPVYFRIPSLGCQEDFIRGLARLCQGTVVPQSICSSSGKRICPPEWKNCPGAV